LLKLVKALKLSFTAMANLNKKILIVEDDRDYLFILKTTFSQAGFSVAEAGNAEDGLAFLKKENPDLIILDILLPGMSGMDMAKKMKEEGIKTPIMFLTNVSDENEISKAFQITASDYVIKSDTRVEDVVLRAKSKLGLK